jgi:hypothetical protein
MKKFGKIFLITLVSLLGILIVTISIVLWLVFTPERLTPIIRKQADKYIPCQSEIGEVELTFFSTFPNLGVKIKQFALINPVTYSPCDTLISLDEITGVVDASAWWKNNEIILIGLELTRGSVNVFTDSAGNTNYDIVAVDTTSSPEPASESEIPSADIRNISLNDVSLNYNDLSLKLNTVIRNLTAKFTGTITHDSINADFKIKKSEISFEYDGEKYLQQASVLLSLPVDFIPSRQFIRLKNATASVNNLELLLNGSAENDTLNKTMITDLNYKFSSWQIKDILALIPPSFNSYIAGIDAEGLLSSEGSIKGLMSDSVMPVMDIRVQIAEGTAKYSDFPLPLHDIEGDVSVYTDLKSDALSFVNIREFSAKTPGSAIRIKGLVNQIFSDINCDLTTTASLKLDEFNQMIPDSMKIDLMGRMSGNIKSAFSMAQIEKMQIERMKLAGSLTFSGLDLKYDSISMKTDRTKIDFALPNYKASSKNTKFAFATILMDNIEAGKLDSYDAKLNKANISFETSDARDTTRIPDLICSFNIDSLFASVDTISISIASPNGKIILSPRIDAPDQPRIILSYNSEQLKSIMGANSFALNKITVNTDILNDNTQKDIFLQWLVKGFIDMDQGLATIDGFTHPIEIPAEKMNFEPETFNIQDSRVKIDKSDFQLTGDLNNVLSYFRGDSILRGKFNFVSNTTDVSQLMALTSGLGNKDTTIMEEPAVQDADTTYSGPYMVPEGVDLLLTTNIKKATMGAEIATNIIGDVQVSNGSLVLDGLTFETPAARMQLTAMYRTPRKNHLFLGLDYHMLDIEIGELLTMIPDIDTLMPMLRSFGGKGEFHIAVETYLDSLYNLKKSTLRGASSITGNDLVLMDGETFSEIAKTLRFNKKTENRVDSLSAEFTIFRNEIDIYPFLIVMDKYKAVIAGRHNFDMSFDYHISVVDCPLPIKLGMDVKGNVDDLSYRLAQCRYAEYYRPSSRRVVENKQLELRKLIRETLTQKVKD